MHQMDFAQMIFCIKNLCICIIAETFNIFYLCTQKRLSLNLPTAFIHHLSTIICLYVGEAGIGYGIQN